MTSAILVNNSSGDSVLTTDSRGLVKLKYISPAASRWSFSQNKLYDLTDSIGIGTSNTKGYNLAVNGSAIFTKAVVKLFSKWPDYVFEPTYVLRPLSSVEEYIKKNKHLPEISSDEEIKKDGLDLGNSNVVLLKKIEELTLYLIKQNNENISLQKELYTQNQENEIQNKMLLKLQKSVRALQASL